MIPTYPGKNWTSADVQELCALAALVESRVAHEVNFIGNRMTWLVVSESFLFTAFATILTVPNAQVTATARCLAISLPVLGVSIAAIVWPSVLAATKVMHALTQTRGTIDKQIKRLAIPNWISLGTESREPWLRDTVARGDWPVKYVPPLLIAAWLAVIAAWFF